MQILKHLSSDFDDIHRIGSLYDQMKGSRTIFKNFDPGAHNGAPKFGPSFGENEKTQDKVSDFRSTVAGWHNIHVLWCSHVQTDQPGPRWPLENFSPSSLGFSGAPENGHFSGFQEIRCPYHIIFREENEKPGEFLGFRASVIDHIMPLGQIIPPSSPVFYA